MVKYIITTTYADPNFGTDFAACETSRDVDVSIVESTIKSNSQTQSEMIPKK